MKRWPDLTDEKVVELKREHGGEKLTASDVKLPRQAGGGTATIVWREPTYDDWDAAQAADARAVEDVMAANRHLAEALIVWPAAQHVEQLCELPNALNRWMADEILPFFGAGAKIKSRAL